ncbi:MAG: hypothetical protein B5M53_08740 [Candidatus Cloacimonas sp. 4484_209]|nr:MAG: hypothetical protein B5M53_08740 [Candidatus Cloacimonas sp. 4484_209]
MKIIFIYPDRYSSVKKPRFRFYRAPPLNLLTIAGMTSDDFEMEIIDERYKQINFDVKVDIVAITVLTTHAPRSYEIADEFRKRGVFVVLGGVHPTFMYEEAKPHADTIIMGEAENTWDKFLSDFKQGKPKSVYSSSLPDLKTVPLPRWDILPDKSRYIALVQTSRGCPNDCSFCSVTRFSGRKVRVRPVESVLDEIKYHGKKLIIFVDDNILGNIRYAKKLFTSLIPLKIKWVGEASTNLLKVPHMIELAAKSGCRGMFIGFESISQKALKLVNKSFNKVKEYKKLIDTLHHYGIAVIGSFMFGLDTDDKQTFYETSRFLDSVDIDVASLSITTPLPGTRMFDELHSQGKIFEKDWTKFDGLHSTFYPKHISPEQLEKCLDKIYKEFYRPVKVFKRILRLMRYAPVMIPVNIKFMFAARNGLVPDRSRENFI